ncbi:MAG: hypothetical protein K0R38_534 [Polyangiaceae bacterium]|jgi:hypothetical protein|nr:hypothetical protein [Polyangiaceae bacterium]
MKNVSSFTILPVLLALAGLPGCNKSDEQAAAQAQRDAADTSREAQNEANDKIAAAKREADEAEAKAAAARTEVKNSVQKDIDAVDRKISYLKERGATAKGNAQKNVAAAQGEVETRRAAVQANVRKLETETGSAWESAKAAVDRDLTALKAAVDSLETTVTGK